MKTVRNPKSPQDCVSFHIFTTTIHFATLESEKYKFGMRRL